MVRRTLLRWGLVLADLAVGAMPARIAYPLAELAGRSWHRLAPERRALVTENLRRVSEAMGRPTSGPALRRLVRQAFIEHARYYLEVMRIRHYDPSRMAEQLDVRDWDRWEPVLRAGVVIAVPHLGNFEPYGMFVAAHGIIATAPVEEIEPPELFRWLHARRGSGRVRIIPVKKARRPMIEALRRGEVVALAADRDLAGDGIEVRLFGHPTTIPAGPASLALLTDRPLIVASCLRTGPDVFRARGWSVDVERTGDRRADAAAITAAIAGRFEEAIAEAPEQWWGAFQPIWIDQRRRTQGADEPA
jgi:lauroyl/myristoyl acyltransferase